VDVLLISEAVFPQPSGTGVITRTGTTGLARSIEVIQVPDHVAPEALNRIRTRCWPAGLGIFLAAAPADPRPRTVVYHFSRRSDTGRAQTLQTSRRHAYTVLYDATRKQRQLCRFVWMFTCPLRLQVQSGWVDYCTRRGSAGAAARKMPKPSRPNLYDALRAPGQR